MPAPELWTIYGHHTRITDGNQTYTAAARRVTRTGRVLPLKYGWRSLKADHPIPRGITGTATLEGLSARGEAKAESKRIEVRR